MPELLTCLKHKGSTSSLFKCKANSDGLSNTHKFCAAWLGTTSPRLAVESALSSGKILSEEHGEGAVVYSRCWKLTVASIAIDGNCFLSGLQGTQTADFKLENFLKEA